MANLGYVGLGAMGRPIAQFIAKGGFDTVAYDLSPDAEADGEARVYPIEGDDHRIEIVQTLTDIDPEWSEHVAIEMPA